MAGELTYGLERLAMYVQGVENVYELNFNGRDGAQKVSYGDIFLQAEQEYSRHNFEYADTDMLFEQFRMAEAACKKYLEAGWQGDREGGEQPRSPRDGAAGLRPVHQGEPCVQSARRARRDFRDRTAKLYSARARTRQGLRRGVAGNGRRRKKQMSEPQIGGRRPLPINVVAGESYWWCACGRSKSQPFCDGSHKGTEFRPQEWKATANEEVWFCACKRSQHQPLCDGSHKALPA